MTARGGDKIGLVLSGGGARGAYQAGALLRLAEAGFVPDCVAGTSIGALNGAVVCSAKSFDAGAGRLRSLWEDLGAAKIIRPGVSTSRLIASYAVLSLSPPIFRFAAQVALRAGLLGNGACAFDPGPIERLLRETVDADDLRSGTPLWVTVCRAPDFPLDKIEPVLDALVVAVMGKATWFHVNKISSSEVMYNVLLASAAIPLAFPTRSVDGKRYVDGGLKDNVPLRALEDFGCRHSVVIHLSNTSPWDRREFEEHSIIEIRPQKQIQSSEVPVVGYLSSLLDFSPDTINRLMEMGYADAKDQIDKIGAVLSATYVRRATTEEIRVSTAELAADPPLLEEMVAHDDPTASNLRSPARIR